MFREENLGQTREAGAEAAHLDSTQNVPDIRAIFAAARHRNGAPWRTCSSMHTSHIGVQSHAHLTTDMRE
jgi:hypothetical protein